MSQWNDIKIVAQLWRRDHWDIWLIDKNRQNFMIFVTIKIDDRENEREQDGS